MARLSAAERRKLPQSDFALPEKDAYPVDTENRGKSALSRAKQFASPEEQGRIIAKVKSKFPRMDVKAKPGKPTIK